ncbi:protein STIP1 homolog isoform X3 [Rhinatrema bivittatum]|uniref:protein STIP1 homolog isoform X3 n=1 Tax=Rhinatrema bivittatum TaxID=194408 RepID=UPI0011267A61|nr:protein STIP1 homolog isoform X3 [Rhinatrema bivittatum]
MKLTVGYFIACFERRPQILGSETAEDEMDCGRAAGFCSRRSEGAHNQHFELQDEGMSSEDTFSEDDRAKQKAEKRRAKKKRQRERRKLEKIKTHVENEQQDPEWDVTSAFFANAASHIKPKSRTKLDKNCRENKENERRIHEEDSNTSTVQRSRQHAERGIELVERGKYSQAVELFSEAIKLEPEDHRYFGNRSYCYEQLKRYQEALLDAETAIRLSSNWPKGYFRKGRAMLGIKKYMEAEAAFEMVLHLDKNCREALKEILACRVCQLMELGFTQTQSISLLEEFKTVPDVLEAPISAKVLLRNASSCFDEPEDDDLVLVTDQSETLCSSLWVGNITIQVKEKQLRDLFKNFGEIDSIRLLCERFCAFVNFKCPTAAARALDELQGKEVENTKLVIRYPDKHYRAFTVSTSAAQTKAMATQTGSRRKGPVKGNECYFWRTTGCHFGEKCRHRHVPENRAI